MKCAFNAEHTKDGEEHSAALRAAAHTHSERSLEISQRVGLEELLPQTRAPKSSQMVALLRDGGAEHPKDAEEKTRKGTAKIRLEFRLQPVRAA